MTKPLLLAVPALLLCGCNVEYDAGPSNRESKSIELDKVEVIRAQLKMPVGELRVSGGSAKLLDADFEYRPLHWKPDVRYSSTGFRGNLLIEQASDKLSKPVGNANNSWTLRFTDKVPIDFEFSFGVGEADIDLSKLNVRSVDVKMGVGELRLDLRGKPLKDYSVRIRGGIGEARIQLPADVGVVAYARGGIGGVDAHGMSKIDGRWVNSAHQKKAPVTVRLDIEGGIGHIELISE